MIKTIIFDVDGTLLNTERIYMRSWVEGAADFGYHIPHAALLETRAVNRSVAMEVFRRYCGPDFPYMEILEYKKAIIDRLVEETPPEKMRMPHVREVLAQLRDAGFTLVTASSSPVKTSREHLERTGILEFLTDTVGGDMVTRGKPNPDIFLKAAELAGSTPDECFVVGDTPADVLAATAAGMPVFLIPDQVPANEQTTALSRRVLSGLAELPEAIKEALG
jgi:HAD superfamily hydrolase (TIGR01509 family)